MLRILVILVALTTTCRSTFAGEVYRGILTFGCGDRYIKMTGDGETWFVNLAPSQESEMLRMTGIGLKFLAYQKWMSLYVEFAARQRFDRKPGFFSEHPGQFDVEWIKSARSLKDGESVHRSVGPPRKFRGLYSPSWEGNGFVSFDQRDEYWWVVAGKVGWQEMDKPFGSPISSTGPVAVIEVLGRVGPPGAYGHMGDFSARSQSPALATSDPLPRTRSKAPQWFSR